MRNNSIYRISFYPPYKDQKISANDLKDIIDMIEKGKE